MSINRKNNKLSEFPTEALLYQYRRNRLCKTVKWRGDIVRVYNSKKNRYDFWKAIKENVLWDDGKEYYTVVSYEKCDDVTIKDFIEITTKQGGYQLRQKPGKKYDVWTWVGNYIEIHFGKLHWSGDLSELKKELSKRPNVNVDGGHCYRKWLNNYKKNLKK